MSTPFRRLVLFDPRKVGIQNVAVSHHGQPPQQAPPQMATDIFIKHADNQELQDQTITTPDERLNLSERQQAVWVALGKLSPKLREVAILRYFAGMQYKEIGTVLEIPAKTAESRMRSGPQGVAPDITGSTD
ncbi:MAG: sigma-70 family RNA polymerase sigma factor [Chloroflexota bacterium]